MKRIGDSPKGLARLPNIYNSECTRRIILFGRKLILKLEGRFLERKSGLHKIKTWTRANLKRSSSGDRNSILMFRLYVLRESFQGKYPLQSLNSLWFFLVFRCKISFELVVHVRYELLAPYNTTVSKISCSIPKPVYLF